MGIFGTIELAIMQFIQSFANPVLDVIFKAITEIGGETICIVVMAAVYWAISKKHGETLGFITLASVSANGMLKDAFKIHRPIGVEGINTDPHYGEELKLDVPAADGYQYSYSFPSGHSQTTATVYTSLALFLKKWWAKLLCVIIFILVGISRMYLGVHWPSDVLVGWGLGIVLAVGLYLLLEKTKINKYIIYIAGTVIVSAVGFIFFPNEGTLKSIGMLVGFVVGVIFENKLVNFSTDGIKIWKRILRVVIGVGLILGVRLGLKAVFPPDAIFGFIRYFLMLFVGVGLWPLIFKKINL